MPIDDEPSVAEVAALTARLRELSNAGAAVDPVERAAFLADKDALIARIAAAGRADEGTAGSGDAWADYRTYTRSEAAAELVARGVPADQADGTVERYLSPEQWEIDDDDLAAMLDPQAGSDLGLTGGEGPPLDAGPTLTAEEAAHELAADGRSLDVARALVRGYLDEVSERVGTPVHQWGLDEAAWPTSGPVSPASTRRLTSRSAAISSTAGTPRIAPPGRSPTTPAPGRRRHD